MKKSLCLLVLLFASLKMWATNYYVSPSGNNNSDGTSTNTPFQTLQKGHDVAVGGDTVFVMAGTYSSATTTLLKITQSGSPNAYITYKAYASQKPKIKISGNVWNAVTINGNYIVIDGIELEGNNAGITYDQAFAAYTNYINSTAGPLGNFNTNGFSIGGPNAETRFPHHVVIRNCIVHDFPGGGISSIQADYTTIENNLVYNNAWYMMYAGSGISILNPFDSDTVRTYKNIVRNNICHTNKTTIPWVSGRKLSDGNGIIIDVNQYPYGGASGGVQYVGRTLVENNLCVNNGGSGIHSFRANHVDIINNTAYQNATIMTDYGNLFVNDGVDVNVFNNINYAATGKKCNVTTNKNINVNYGYNTYFNGSVAIRGTNDTVIDPKFINPDTNRLLGDFRLQSTSPAINQGSNVAGQYSLKDILGVARPQGIKPDRGAYEYTIGTSLTTLNEAEKATIFPNPTQKTLTIQLASSPVTHTRLDIVDSMGVAFKTQKLTTQTSIVSVEELPTGLYMVVVYQNERVVSVNKFVKE